MKQYTDAFVGLGVLGFSLGTLLGLFLADHSNGVVSTQRGYTEGRESVLSSIVYIGGVSDDQCSVAIPLSALADMVTMGVLDWHELCKTSE